MRSRMKHAMIALFFASLTTIGFTQEKRATDSVADSLLRSAVSHYAREDISDSSIVKLFTGLSDRGDVRGKMWLARLHFKGRCKLPVNPGLAGTLALSALAEVKTLAEAGDAEAQFLMGSCYQEGLGVQVNFQEAVMWYALAVNKGQIAAFGNLAQMIASAEGTVPDIVEARKLFARGAQLGSAYCQKRVEWYQEPDSESIRRQEEIRQNALVRALGMTKQEAVRMLVATHVISSPKEFFDYKDGSRICLNFEDDGVLLYVGIDGRIRTIDAYQGMTDSDRNRGGIPFDIGWDDNMETIYKKLGKPYQSSYIREDLSTALTYHAGSIFFTLLTDLTPDHALKFWRVRENWAVDYPASSSGRE